MPDEENARLEVLHDYHILDTEPENSYDDIVRLAAFICATPIASITLIDAKRQWFKSALGLTHTETPRDVAFCAHTILQPDLLVIQDAQQDPRFSDNPFVIGDPDIRFYAGVPLITESGHALGSLCVIDREPRNLTPQQEDALRTLAHQVTNNFELARKVAIQDQLMAEREQAVEEMQQAVEEMKLAAVRQRVFLGDVLAGVTDGHLILCHTFEELPSSLSPFDGPIALSLSGGLRELRYKTQEAAESIGLSSDRTGDLVAAVGETGMNAIVHAGKGIGQVFVSDITNTVQVSVTDLGSGIKMENLPHATLKKGYTTSGTLGYGMKMMLQTTDRAFLLTGVGGTTVVLEQDHTALPKLGHWD